MGFSSAGSFESRSRRYRRATAPGGGMTELQE